MASTYIPLESMACDLYEEYGTDSRRTSGRIYVGDTFGDTDRSASALRFKLPEDFNSFWGSDFAILQGNGACALSMEEPDAPQRYRVGVLNGAGTIPPLSSNIQNISIPMPTILGYGGASNYDVELNPSPGPVSFDVSDSFASAHTSFDDYFVILLQRIQTPYGAHFWMNGIEEATPSPQVYLTYHTEEDDEAWWIDAKLSKTISVSLSSEAYAVGFARLNKTVGTIFLEGRGFATLDAQAELPVSVSLNAIAESPVVASAELTVSTSLQSIAYQGAEPSDAKLNLIAPSVILSARATSGGEDRSNRLLADGQLFPPTSSSNLLFA